MNRVIAFWMVGKHSMNRRRRQEAGSRRDSNGCGTKRLRQKRHPFWQRRFYDFNVWSWRKKNEKLNYMHFNPVKRGLVKHPKDWEWSSFGFYSTRKSNLCTPNPQWEPKARRSRQRSLAHPSQTVGRDAAPSNIRGAQTNELG